MCGINRMTGCTVHVHNIGRQREYAIATSIAKASSAKLLILLVQIIHQKTNKTCTDTQTMFFCVRMVASIK